MAVHTSDTQHVLPALQYEVYASHVSQEVI